MQLENAALAHICFFVWPTTLVSYELDNLETKRERDGERNHVQLFWGRVVDTTMLVMAGLNAAALHKRHRDEVMDGCWSVLGGVRVRLLHDHGNGSEPLWTKLPWQLSWWDGHFSLFDTVSGFHSAVWASKDERCLLGETDCNIRPT